MNETPELFYKYRSFNSLTLDSLCLDEVYFSNPKDFNDPFDCNPSIECDSSNAELENLLSFLIKKRVKNETLSYLEKSKITGEKAIAHANKVSEFQFNQTLAEIKYYSTNPEYTDPINIVESWFLTQEIRVEIKEHYSKGIFCLAQNYLNPLMWSHYADNHKGICIGYSNDRRPKPVPQKAVYDDNRIIKTSVIHNAFIKNSDSDLAKLEEAVLLKKSPEWGYENEWRLIGPQGVSDSPFLLKEIIFGLRCDSTIMHTIIKALEDREYPVCFYQMRYSGNNYKLKREEIDTNESSGYLPKTAESGIEIFGDIEP